MSAAKFQHHGKQACSLWLVASVVVLGCERTELLGVLHTATGGTGGALIEGPRVVETISDPGARDTDPSFTEDLSELYFMSDRTGNKEIWRSERPERSGVWGAPELVSELNTEGEEENPTISNDGRDIWFFTDRDRPEGSLWHASRALRGEPFGAPEPVPELTTGDGSSDVSVAVDPTRTLFILNSKLTGNQPYQLWEVRRDGPDGAYAEPVLLANVVSSSDEFDPDLRRGGRFLAFDTRREGRGQIYFSERGDSSERFPASAPFEALRSDAEDGAVVFSEDLDYVMFSSDRTGNIEIFEAVLGIARTADQAL
jgi:Tol biopolymer transport system component